MLEIFREAGWPIYLLLLASIFALAFIIERFYSLRPSRIVPRALFQQVVAESKQRRVDVAFLDELYQHSPLGRVFSVVLRSAGMSRPAVRDVIDEESSLVMCELEKFLTGLGTIATIAPLLGLFGTVIGMIHIFGAGNGIGANPQEMAHGISIALYNTAFGLIVAIPSLIFYRYFRALVERFVTDIESQSVRLLDVMYGYEGNQSTTSHLSSPHTAA